VPRSPSEGSLNLTVVLVDTSAAVGTGRLEVGPRPTAISPGTVTSVQVRGVAEHDQDLVGVPVCSRSYDSEALRQDTGNATILYISLCMTAVSKGR